MAENPEPDVTNPEILQDDPESILHIDPVPVHVRGPVQAQILPPRNTTFRSFIVGASEGVQLLGYDLTRSRVILYSNDEPIYIGNSKNAVEGATPDGALWPELETLPVLGASAIFVRCATASAQTVLTVIAEYWPD